MNVDRQACSTKLGQSQARNSFFGTREFYEKGRQLYKLTAYAELFALQLKDNL